MSTELELADEGPLVREGYIPMYPRVHRMKVVRAPDLPMRALPANASIAVDVETYC